MHQTFLNLPESITKTIQEILAQPEYSDWVKHAQDLHERYLTRTMHSHSFIHDPLDIISYVAVRAPATYAQISSCLLQLQEMYPNWKPESLLDLGCGPGTGIWAAKEIFPSLNNITGVDRETSFLAHAEEFEEQIYTSKQIHWIQSELQMFVTNDNQLYDLVIIANVCNELQQTQRQQLIELALSRTKGIVVILEPGTSYGFEIIKTIAKSQAEKQTILAPYSNGTFVDTHEYWLHFPQRFIRPDFLRRFRQSLREESLMSSDFEETKYSYVALGNKLPSVPMWGRCVGEIKKQKGFLTIPILTSEKIEEIKVLKRHKQQYTFAKNLRWGDSISEKQMILFSQE